MNAATVARTLSLVPDRLPRAQTGSLFTEEQALRTEQPERIAHLMRFLGWLGPLNPLTKDDLRILGLLNPYVKPAAQGEDEDTLDSEDDLEDPMENAAGVFSEATLPPAPPPAP